jgi:hypothetical protein
MNWQWIVGGIGYVGAVVFVLLWRLERSRHETTMSEYNQASQQLVTAQVTIMELRKQKEAEREALKKLQEVNDKMQQAIDNLPSASRDDLLEFMRNSSTG